MAAPRMTVAELIQASLAKHAAARPRGKGMPRPEGWLDTLRDAADLRKQAEAQDPERKEPGWDKEHADMMAFYRDKLGAL